MELILEPSDLISHVGKYLYVRVGLGCSGPEMGLYLALAIYWALDWPPWGACFWSQCKNVSVCTRVYSILFKKMLQLQKSGRGWIQVANALDKFYVNSWWSVMTSGVTCYSKDLGTISKFPLAGGCYIHDTGIWLGDHISTTWEV